MFTELQTAADLDRVLADSQHRPAIVFKHSNQCGLSTRAYRSLSKLDEFTDLPVHMLVVQTARPLSNEIEARFGIRHESPQVIVVSNREPVFNASHHNATAEAVGEALSRIETQKQD